MAALAAVYGAVFGLLPIGWIILNVIFLYQLAKDSGEFQVLQRSISRTACSFSSSRDRSHGE